MEMLQREELGGSKGNQHEVFFDFLLKNNFLTLIANKF
jgi:hypothetical protein